MANDNLRRDLGVTIDGIMQSNPVEVRVGVRQNGGRECIIFYGPDSENERRVKLLKPITPDEVLAVLRPFSDIDYILQDPTSSDDGKCYHSLVRRHSA